MQDKDDAENAKDVAEVWTSVNMLDNSVINPISWIHSPFSVILEDILSIYMPYNLCAHVFSPVVLVGAFSDPSNEQTSVILQPDQCLLSRMLFFSCG